MKEKDRLNFIIESTDVATWEWNLQTGKTVFNDKWAEILGYKLEELEPTTIATWEKHTHPEDLKRAKIAMKKHLNGKKDFYSVEIRMKHKDGHWIWVNDRGKVTSWSKDNKALRMFGIFIEITERKNKEQKIVAAKELIENLTNQAPGTLYQYQLFPDGSSCFPYASEGIYEIYEVTPAEVIEDAGKVFERIHPDDYQGVVDSIEKSAETLEIWHHKYRVMLPEQGKKWVEGTSKPEKLKDGSVLWHGNIREITEEKRKEEKVKVMKERLELAVEGGNIGIWDWNIETGETYFNENWFTMIGYQEGELDYNVKSWENLIHPDDLSRVKKEITDFLAGKTNIYITEHRIKTKAGNYKWIKDMGKVIRLDEDSNPLRAVGIHLDIDKEKRSRKQVEFLSYHDSLTGLYNYRYLMEEIQRISNSRNYPISIVIADLDRLKFINDNFGHKMGDKYIKKAAEILTGIFRQEDVVSRIGGDEFAIILPDTDNYSSRNIINRVRNRVEIIREKNKEFKFFNISIGVATMADNSVSFEHAYKEADKKMYEDKNNSKKSKLQ